MRVLFIGQNGPFTFVPLKAVAGEHKIVGIVESAPRNYSNGTGTKYAIKDKMLQIYRSLKRVPTLQSDADSNSIPYFFLTRENHKQLLDFISQTLPDIICVASMSQLLRKEAYLIPRYGAINFHPALLPQYRGPNPWVWQYLMMEKEVGATIHYIDEGEDTGDIIKQERIPVPLGILPTELIDSVIHLGARLMVQALAEIESSTVHRIAQDHLPCLHRARNVESNEKLIDWNNWPIERVWHALRGTSFWLKNNPSKIPGLEWNVGGYCKCKVDGVAGSRRFSMSGWYLCHSQGRISIRPTLSAKRFIITLLNRVERQTERL